jgi:hypothetical protein
VTAEVNNVIELDDVLVAQCVQELAFLTHTRIQAGVKGECH